MKSELKRVVMAALLIVASIVLTRFLSIRTPIVTIGFGTIPIIISGICLGPKYAMLVGGLSDLIGALLFPSGAYFFGFTISGCLTGLIYGLFLYGKSKIELGKRFVGRLVASVLIVTILIEGVLNTLWIFIITQNAANLIVPTRIIKLAVMFPIQIAIVIILVKVFRKEMQKLRPQHDSSQRD